ncbi:MAG: hypothetical protein ACE5KH_00020 [Candidatus Geothermarchaeales archaeon]
MIESKTTLSQEKAFEEVRGRILREKGKIAAENPPNSLRVEHGSLWTLSPRNMAKKMKIEFVPETGGTRVVLRSSAPTWEKAANAISVIIFVVVLGVAWSIFSGWEAELSAARGSLSGWFLELFGVTEFQEALALIGTAKMFLLALVGVVAILGVVQLYQYSRTDAFAEELIYLLPR